MGWIREVIASIDLSSIDKYGIEQQSHVPVPWIGWGARVYGSSAVYLPNFDRCLNTSHLMDSAPHQQIYSGVSSQVITA